MYLECLLTFKSYRPLKLEKGMLFYINGTIREITSTQFDYEEFVNINGYPVEMFVVEPGNPNLYNGTIIATPDQIGWFDEGDHSDELSDISVKNINDILEQSAGLIDVEMMETEDGDYVPVLYDGKITIRIAQEEEEEEEEPPALCTVCNGSGEGMYDGSICDTCGGDGVKRENNNYFNENY